MIAALTSLLPVAMNAVGGLLGSAVGQPPPLPPPLPPPAPVPPPVPVYSNPSPGVTIIEKWITSAPSPDPTREPEKLTTYGIIGIVFCLAILICCVAAGIGFYCWQSQKAEADRRANESRDRDLYAMEAGGRGGRGRRRGRGSSGTSGTSGTTRTRGHKTRRH